MPAASTCEHKALLYGVTRLLRALKKVAKGLVGSRRRSALRGEDIRELFSHDEAVTAIVDVVAAQRVVPSLQFGQDEVNAPVPYEGIGIAQDLREECSGEGATFVTSRFRSGSTLLWNVFRHLSCCTAFYEPFNCFRVQEERRKFVDSTHRGVSNYWREYEDLSIDPQVFRERWSREGLYMDDRAWDPEMKKYLALLIKKSVGKPVLQFNRIDFRLPWLRSNFPHATIIHLYRHPRDQWCSTLRGAEFSTNGSIEEFRRCDSFELLQLSARLSVVFPFLNGRYLRHPYEVSYCIWRLSYLYGQKYADVSLSYESLVDHPRDQLERLFDVLDIPNGKVDELLHLVQPRERNRWKLYAERGWFEEREAHCEGLIQEFFRGQETEACYRTRALAGVQSKITIEDGAVA